MAFSSVQKFSDPENYVAAIRASNFDISITKAGHFSAELMRIDLDHLWMQHLDEALPRIAHFDNAAGRVVISFPTHADPVFYGPIEASAASVVRHSEGHSSFQRAPGPIRFGSMSLPTDYAHELETIYGRFSLQSPRETVVVAPAAAAIARLQNLHAAARNLAAHAPEVLQVREAASSLEAALIAALVDCIAPPQGGAMLGGHHHGVIIKRFYELLRANPDGVLHAPEICKAIGVSNRTLTTACKEFLGISPHHFLKLRQLNLARGALSHSLPGATTVTEIAMAHGFWDLGRFAMSYRALFGESPSHTLRAQSRHPDKPVVDMLLRRSSQFT